MHSEPGIVCLNCPSGTENLTACGVRCGIRLQSRGTHPIVNYRAPFVQRGFHLSSGHHGAEPAPVPRRRWTSTPGKMNAHGLRRRNERRAT